MIQCGNSFAQLRKASQQSHTVNWLTRLGGINRSIESRGRS
jgi:hypothetical protein